MKVILRHHQDKALRKGYPWIFRDQVHRAEGDPPTGSAVIIEDGGGRTLGQGLYHAESIIAIRFLTPDPDVAIDREFFAGRLRRALELRETMFPGATHYRWANGESDGLPGTVIDRYGDVLSFSTICAGMEQRREELLDVLEQLVSPRAIVERNDQWLRAKDGLEERVGILRGEDPGIVTLEEDGVRFRVDVQRGPKTGFFIDQRLHRAAVRHFARGRKVLDAFCADGGFGLSAARAGAEGVHFLDSSEEALGRARDNAALNELTQGATFEKADALDRLGEMVEEGIRFGLVVLDPPAFARSRRHQDSARRAYQRINASALRLLEDGGILATASCSHAFPEKEFDKVVAYSAKRTGASLRLLYRGTQPPDHPILLSMPETRYLKFLVVQKLGDEVPAAEPMRE